MPVFNHQTFTTEGFCSFLRNALPKLLLMLGLVLFGLFASCGRTKTFYQEGVSLELARYRAKHIYDVRYELHFSIPEEQQMPLSGSVAVFFKPLKALHGIILDFSPADSLIKEVRVNGIAANYSWLNGHIYIEQTGLVPRQENRVDVSFVASDQALNRSADFLYTLFVPDRASTAFPCFDQPDMKALLELSLDIPGHWNALSNGPVVKDTLEEGRRLLKFSNKKPISTYLMAFAAGIFEHTSEERNGRTINIFHRETDIDKLNRNLPRVFELHFLALDWLEEYTGIAYPYEKFDLAILPGFQYSGMEHPGAIWYRDSRLLLNENPPITRLISKASLIAHETAHMWFGNLVTMQWFDDVWLKEVFAGFMADKVVGEMFPDVNHQLQFMLNHYPSAYSIDRTNGTHPIKQELANMKMAGTLYGPIIYNKAPIVFEQLEQIMQPANFRAAVKEYLLTFSHGNADWSDLVAIFDKYSPQNISKWSNAWVYGKGMPEITYSIMKGNDRTYHLTLHQTSPLCQSHVFSQLLRGTGIAGAETFNVEFFIDGFDPQSKTIDLNHRPELILLNAGGKGYGFFKLREEDIRYAVENIQYIEDENLRAALALNMHENFLNGNISTHLYFNFVLDAIRYENNQQLQNYLLSNLEQICMNFLPYEAEPVFSHKTEYVLWNSLQSDNVKAKEPFFNSWIKLARSSEHTAGMLQLYDDKLSLPGFTLSEQNRSQLAMEIAMRSAEHAGIVQKELERLENPDRKRRFEYILPAVSHNLEDRIDFFEKLKKPESRNPEPWVLEALYFLHHPLHKGQGMAFIPESLTLLEEIQKTGDIFFPQNWLMAVLGNYHQKEVWEMVEQYLASHPDLPENLRLKVYQASDLLFRARQIP